MKGKRYMNNERGTVLATTMWVLAALAVTGSAVSLVVSTNAQVGRNSEIGIRTFYSSEAGVEEARARLRESYPNSPIDNDGHQTSLTWRAFIGSATDAAALGYNPSNPDHVLYTSLQGTFSYAVRIEHATMNDGAGNTVVARWGDDNDDQILTKNPTEGENIFIITSAGKSFGANRTTLIEAGRFPPVVAPGAVYVEAQTNVLGSSTNVLGMDQCGNEDVPGIASTLDGTDPDDVNQNGNPTITGAPTPIQFDTPDINVQEIINRLKKSPDFAYSYNSNTTLTGTSIPGPGEGWGTPTQGATLQNASSCPTTAMNIIYVNMQNAYELKLSGGVTGCGFLLVEGDLQMHGSFFWHGTILATGSVTFTGGGNKNVTGYVLSEGTLDVDVVGGNANIVNCSTVKTLLRSTQPLAILRWLEGLDG